MINVKNNNNKNSIISILLLYFCIIFIQNLKKNDFLIQDKYQPFKQ